jgi:predicted anti-sigma-YlaC factor YlaD
MNCQSCHKEFDAYREGKLSDDMRVKVEEHLLSCAECKELYALQLLVEKVVSIEKALAPEPYLLTRIMAQIENREEGVSKIMSPFKRVLRPVLIMTAMAAAIFAGVLVGNIYKPSNKVISMPVELALMDDVAIESVNILSNE